MKNFTVYRSSAGSGKTYTLAVNYLALAISKSLIKRDYYKKILAITFTNKAAQEMKERVLYYLNILSQGKDIDNILSEIISKTGVESQDIFKISKNIYSHILHNYSDLSIQTIDKFSYKIVKTFSSDLGMNRDFELELDSNKIIQPVIALLLNKVSDNNSLLTDVLVNFTYPAFTEAFAGANGIVAPIISNSPCVSLLGSIPLIKAIEVMLNVDNNNSA